MSERLPRNLGTFLAARSRVLREWSIPRVVRPPTFLIYVSSLLFSCYGTIVPLASFASPSVILPPFGLREMKTTTRTRWIMERIFFSRCNSAFYGEYSLEYLRISKEEINIMATFSSENSRRSNYIFDICASSSCTSRKLRVRRDMRRQDCLFCGPLNASNTSLRHYRARHVLNFRRVKYNLLSLRNFKPSARSWSNY